MKQELTENNLSGGGHMVGKPRGLRFGRHTDRVASMCICGDHAFLVLTKGYVTLMDPGDADLASVYSWSAKQYSKHLVYARRGKRAPYALHNFLVGMNGLDHINGNGLDNRRRIAANGKRIELGYFKTEAEAAEAYAKAAEKLHGEFARY